MARWHARFLQVAAFVALAATPLSAQYRRTAGGPDAAATAADTPKNAAHPYTGLWIGPRVMGSRSLGDEVLFRIVSAKTGYDTFMILPNGAEIPNPKVVATRDAISWESPNSGGGTWIYRFRLVGADSMAGTLVLRDAPKELGQVRGTIALHRRGPIK